MFPLYAISPPLVWGNQEPIWPLNPATLHYITTDRLKQLAVPKTDHRVKDSIVYVLYNAIISIMCIII